MDVQSYSKFTSIITVQRNVGFFESTMAKLGSIGGDGVQMNVENETLQHSRAAPAESFGKVSQFPLMDAAPRYM